MLRRRRFFAMAIVTLLLLVPHTVMGESNTRDGSVVATAISITTSVDEVESSLEYDIEFGELSANMSYNYQIWFTRVDPDFVHERIQNSFTAEDNVHTISSSWSPPQDGPWTIHAELLNDYGAAIDSNTGLFDWGDLWNNSDSVQLNISPEPELTHYDLFENESLRENVSVTFDFANYESGADYKLRWKLYRGIGINDQEFIVGEGPSSWYSRSVAFSSLQNYWENNTNFTIATWLYRVDNIGDQDVLVEIDSKNWTFAIGKGPEIIIAPIVQGCMNPNANNYNPQATVDDGSCKFDDTDGDGVYDYLEIEGCMDENATNYNLEATDDDGSCEYSDQDGDGVFDHLEVEGCMDKNATNYDLNATDDDDSCEYADQDGDGVFDHLEVEGCTDENALNYDSESTDDDGSCEYPPLLRAEIVSNQTTGEGPLSIQFSANISGGVANYEIEWVFGDGEISNLKNPTHVFAPGVYNVALQVRDSRNSTAMDSIQIVVEEPEIVEELSGYISHSAQLEPITLGMAGALEFTAIITGGVAPYTFAWDFGDGNTADGDIVLHEYSEFKTYAVKIRISDSENREIEYDLDVEIIERDDPLTNATSDIVDGGEISDLGIYVTSASAAGLLLIFGLFGRKRRENFLDAERRMSLGGPSIWDD